jgi:hypothetical protein
MSDTKTDALLKRINPTIKKLLDAQRELIMAESLPDSNAYEAALAHFNARLENIAAETMP